MRLLGFLATGLSATLFFSSASGQSTVPAWGQCGGNGWGGGTACVSGYTCSILNTPTTASARPSSTSTASVATATNIRTTSRASTTLVSVTTTAAGGGGGGTVPTTIVSGWYWIRAVASPNFHNYLQAKPTSTPSKAYLESPSGAGQFKIESGGYAYVEHAGHQPP
ncbi:hypothetical protein CH063_03600 [Colletotrichum higginsianum]|uniref:Carbohydrate-binding module family 1 protein n=1 Tax=Colletotrichum higginsianum (strain IMI 349063) TaxID=759273 RepID=H1VYX6_COLHI|nr:Carbohydrate-binding module family 1 protein [Colletotrichum higginsianum IMI 349063]OBR13090.1 Carbohydrate-binding module family 1 protein [Colletotrichum higginsianum IMI 349063]CCF45438.1 hypothetical protein CH063_03600 [Colletotrichum higginsianum]